MWKAFPCHDVTIKNKHFSIVAKGLDCHLSGNRKHDDVIKWKDFLRYLPFVRGIHRSPVNSPHKGQWRGALLFSLIWVWINGWVNNHRAGDLRRHRAHDDVIVMNIVVNDTSNPHVAISKFPVNDLNSPGFSSCNLHLQQRCGAWLFKPKSWSILVTFGICLTLWPCPLCFDLERVVHLVFYTTNRSGNLEKNRKRRLKVCTTPFSDKFIGHAWFEWNSRKVIARLFLQFITEVSRGKLTSVNCHCRTPMMISPH